ncbi:hypothetical protein AVEN_2231-1 [Araneus ventricosus]|uniref:Uncharacterized protein n=1 Tax=Araneus ventricosus TaxID=182803 RepID=A0A4Y2P1V9_ARAVE|nr:hypothetical protein AVEN_2231-1 [Araneus ventricosus]
MYFGDFSPPYPRALARARVHLPLQYFKSYSEEHVYQVSSKLPGISLDLFVISIFDTLPTLPLGTGLRLIYPFNTSSRLMRNLCSKFHQNWISHSEVMLEQTYAGCPLKSLTTLLTTEWLQLSS